jgi:monomeric isocitrate dehydrogenase
LAVSRARATGAKAIFWLNPARAHDANVIALAHKYLAEHDVAGKYSSLFVYFIKTLLLYMVLQ